MVGFNRVRFFNIFFIILWLLNMVGLLYLGYLIQLGFMLFSFIQLLFHMVGF